MIKYALAMLGYTICMQSALAQEIVNVRLTGGTLTIEKYARLVNAEIIDTHLILSPNVKAGTALIMGVVLRDCTFDPPLDQWAERVNMVQNLINP